MYSTHYSKAQNLPAMSRIAKKKAEYLIKLFSQKEYKDYKPLLAYSGMSGISFATMIGFYLSERKFDYGMAYVRKSGEKSHGENVESMYHDRHASYQFVFVDDFISSGSTFNKVIRKINKTLVLRIRYVMPKRKKNYAAVLVQQGRVQNWPITKEFVDSEL